MTGTPTFRLHTANLYVPAGIISGVQSFLVVAIDRTFDYLCSSEEHSSSKCSCSARGRKSAQSEEHAVQMKVLNPVAT
jgi:hypothetical protein